ncbi:cell division protein [Novosphingobium sp. H3SJ31-1]|uniref:Cell division protein n=2 Tax=Novosphingobium album (ex Liu et al. 2023) TaxID=3031130 RepID=A0ABT5WR45_9SPHN|nr:cell division protein [Novosphingobium album (ex Liu et al. 2023)]MDE8652503.1 cell division protein [Novosphingobium album (ex Liu et al. 2023)]
MPWVIAIMVALTVIALAGGLSLGNAVVAARAELEGGVTVQIVEARAEVRKAEARAALDALRDMPGVVTLRLVPDEEVDALIEPWLGDGLESAVGSAVPVPALIDVRFDGPATRARLAAVQARLAKVAPSARVDAQSNWLRPVFDAIVSLQWLAIALVALLAAALAAAVLLAARTALGTNRDTIEIVHLLGGTDAQIARVFQRSIAIDAMAGGLVGLVLAVVVILFLGRRFAGLGAGMVDNGALGPGDWVLLALVPVLSTLLAMITARLTVVRALRKML